MLHRMKKKTWISLLLIVCLICLTACGGKSNRGENQSTVPGAGRAEEGRKTEDAGSSGEEPLGEVNEIPEDGIITKEQFATVAGEDRDIRFVGETEDGIKYTWTYHAAQIQNPEDQNLKIDFETEDLSDIKKQANNANDALKMTMHGKGLICPPQLVVEIPEAWQSDTGVLLKEQNDKLAKMSEVTIESVASEEDTGEKEDKSDAKESSTESSQTDSLTKPGAGTTTLTMTVLSLDGDSYIVGGITDVDKLAAINQRAQANASASSDSGGTETTSSGDSGSGNSGSGSDNKGSSGSKSSSGSNKPGDVSNSGSSGSNSGSTSDSSGKSSGSGSGSSSDSSGGTCTISISCATILNNMSNLTSGKEEFVPSDGWILKSTKVTFSSGESVHDVLQRVCREKGIHMESSYTPAYDSAYVEGINQLYEFDCGELSGWMYSVNGWFPNYGCSKYSLSDGDVIKWVYTCDLGKDVGDNSMY